MTEPFMLRAMLAGLALAFIAAPMGCFLIWRRMEHFGATIAQGGLIGAALAAVLSTSVSLTMLTSVMLLAVLAVRFSRTSHIRLDIDTGVTTLIVLAAGIVVASLVRGPNVDLMAILFGDIYGITQADLEWILIAGALTYVGLVAMWNPLLSIAIDTKQAAAEGIPVDRTRVLFIVILAIVVVIATKIVGALLTVAFLVIPAAASRPYSETPEQMAFFATIFATLGVAFGMFVSVSLDAPGGPSIVLVLAVMFALAFIPVMLSGRASR